MTNVYKVYRSRRGVVTKRFVNGSLKRHVDKRKNGTYIEKWYSGYALHRDNDLPAYTKTTSDGTVIKEWYQHGECHRDNDQPAVIEQYPNGQFLEEWYQHGECHRDDDLPAVIQQYANGQYAERWYRYGECHRDNDLPAVIKKYPNGQYLQKWIHNDKHYRQDNKPNLTVTDFYTSKVYEYNYIEGVGLDKDINCVPIDKLIINEINSLDKSEVQLVSSGTTTDKPKIDKFKIVNLRKNSLALCKVITLLLLYIGIVNFSLSLVFNYVE